MKNIPGSLFTYAAAVILLGFGLNYLFKNSFMPYHSDAISREWEEVPPATQFLILALMRATSGGFISIAVAIIFLQYKLAANKSSWMPFLILAIGTISMVCSLYAMVTVSAHTPGRPPASADIIGEALLLTGFVFNLIYIRKNR
jgi:hypothetical protein